MEAKFIGDPAENGARVPETFEAHGVTFERDHYSDIPKALEGKFSGNSHFEIKGAKPAVEPEPDPFAGLGKPAIIEALTARGVEHDPAATKAVLLEQLRAAPEATLPVVEAQD